MAARHQDYITYVRAETKKLMDAYGNLKEAAGEWGWLDYSNTLPDGVGANAGYTKQMVSDVVNTTVPAITTLLGQGHGTNLAKLL